MLANKNFWTYSIQSNLVSRIWPGFLAVWAAVILHYVWAGTLLAPNSTAGSATPVHYLIQLECAATGQNPTDRSWYGPYHTLALLLILVATLAVIGLLRKKDPPHIKVLWLIPQQLVLGISAAGAVLAMSESHYSDGVLRGATFIVADQLAVVLTWLFHTLSILILFLVGEGYLTPSGAVPIKVPEDE